MYTYKSKIIDNPICVHFLCGCKYESGAEHDKRNVLLNYIDSLDNNYGLILEKQFTMRDYESMRFKDLEEVELMTAQYAKSIIIFHETISTGAEIALFGSNKKLKNKILVLYAPYNVIKTNNVGGFLSLAFFRSRKVKKQTYGFVGEPYNPPNSDIRYYKTSFCDNKIDENLKNILNEFWQKTSKEQDLSFIKYDFYKQSNFYRITEKDKKINIILNYEFVFSFVISCMVNDIIREEIRNIENTISKICELLKNILLNTIEQEEILDSKDYTTKLLMYDKNQSTVAVRFCVNILKAINLIHFRNGKLVFTRELDRNLLQYKDLIIKKEQPSFFGDDNNE